MYKRFILCLLLLFSACTLDDDTSQAPRPRIDSFNAESTRVQVGEAVRFRWSFEAQTSGLTCRLEPGDGTPEYVKDCAEGEQTHIYTESGMYTAKLSVVGAAGLVDTATEEGVEVTREPEEEPEEPSSFTDLTWQAVAPQPYKVGEAQGEVVNGKLYVFGGFDILEVREGNFTPTERAYVFDPEQNTWTPIADMPPMNGTPYGGVTHAGMTTDGEDIFFAGGYTSDEDGDFQIFGTPEAWRYDVSEDSYSRLPNLPQTPESGPNNRHSAGQMEYLNGKLHYFGGTSADRKSDVTYHFVLELANGASEWTQAAPLPEPRNHLGSAVLDGKIYAIGGQTGHDGGLTTHDDVYAYDPVADVWTVRQSLPKAISHISNSSFALEGRIIVIGGEVDHLDAVRDVSAYSPETDEWTALTALPVALQSMVSGTINGTIYVTSGSGGRGGDVSGFQDETYKGVPQN